MRSRAGVGALLNEMQSYATQIVARPPTVFPLLLQTGDNKWDIYVRGTATAKLQIPLARFYIENLFFRSKGWHAKDPKLDTDAEGC